MKKRYWIIGITLVLIILLLAGLLIKEHLSDTPTPLEIDATSVDWQGRQLLQQSFNGTGGIAIPGFDLLYFSADQTTQKVNLYNPSNNDCFFVMSIIVNDTVLWKSGNVAPGQGFYEIELSDPLSKGEYPAKLKIECYTVDGQALNGATVEFDLIVQ